MNTLFDTIEYYLSGDIRRSFALFVGLFNKTGVYLNRTKTLMQRNNTFFNASAFREFHLNISEMTKLQASEEDALEAGTMFSWLNHQYLWNFINEMNGSNSSNFTANQTECWISSRCNYQYPPWNVNITQNLTAPQAFVFWAAFALGFDYTTIDAFLAVNQSNFNYKLVGEALNKIASVPFNLSDPSFRSLYLV